jgi:hypothetical protein
MGRFSGRQTDSHGWTKKKDDRGDLICVPPLRGTPKQRGNKGVMQAYRASKRMEPQAREDEGSG